jgi:hypothetical protein
MIFRVGTPSYTTMNIHHFATILAILHSYFTNFEEYGVLVLVMSDVSDTFLNMGKQCRDLRIFSGWKLDAAYVVMVVVWISARNLCIPICFTQGVFKYITFAPTIFLNEPAKMQMFDAVRFGLHVVFSSVYAISLLNMYWTHMILNLIVQKILKKSNSYTASYETYAKKEINTDDCGNKCAEKAQ